MGVLKDTVTSLSSILKAKSLEIVGMLLHRYMDQCTLGHQDRRQYWQYKDMRQQVTRWQQEKLDVCY